MIDNPNTRNFYSIQEMLDRKNYIPIAKEHLLKELEDLIDKIKKEEPFPHRNMSLDDLVEFSDEIEKLLNNWYY